MGYYRKKPLVIEAWQNVAGPVPDWVKDNTCIISQHTALNPYISTPGGVILINTDRGIMRAEPLDWIIKGTLDEVYVCEAASFETIYEPVGAAKRREQITKWRKDNPKKVAEIQNRYWEKQTKKLAANEVGKK